MIPESQRSFVARLRRETEAGTIKWNEGSENSYFCSQKKYTVYLSYHFDDDLGVSVYRLSLTADGRAAGFGVTSEESDIQEMRDLYASASLSAADFHNLESDFFGD